MNECIYFSLIGPTFASLCRAPGQIYTCKIIHNECRPSRTTAFKSRSVSRAFCHGHIHVVGFSVAIGKFGHKLFVLY